MTILYDNLKDLLKHTQELGFIEKAKITGTKTSTTIEAITEEKSVVFTGTLKTPIEELADHTVGLSRMAVLKGYVNFPPFGEDSATISIETVSRNNEEFPSEIQFASTSGHNAHYRFMSREIAEDQIQVPKFKGAAWDVEYVPTQKNLKDLQYFSGILSGYEPTFGVNVSNNTLSLSIGTGPTDKSMIPFGEVGQGSISGNWRWPLSEFIAILRLSSNSECRLHISNKGVLKLVINSGLGNYEYILPART